MENKKENTDSLYPGGSSYAAATSTGTNTETPSVSAVRLLRRHILQVFKDYLNSRAKKTVKNNIPDADVLIAVGNILHFVIRPSSEELQKWQKLVESVKSGGVESEYEEEISQSEIDNEVTLEPTTAPTSSTGGTVSSVADKVFPESEYSSELSGDFGKPLKLYQTVSHTKVEKGCKITVAYQNVLCADPPKRTPTRRLNRRS